MQSNIEFKVGDLVLKRGEKIPEKITDIWQNPQTNQTMFNMFANKVNLEQLKENYSLFLPDINAENSVVLKTNVENINVKLIDSTERYLIVNGIEIPVDEDFLYCLENEHEYDYIEDSPFTFGRAMIAAGLVRYSYVTGFAYNDLFFDLREPIIEELKKMVAVKKELVWTPTKENIENLPESIRDYIKSILEENETLKKN